MAAHEASHAYHLCHEAGGCPFTVNQIAPTLDEDPSLSAVLGIYARSSLLDLAGPLTECTLVQTSQRLAARLFGAADTAAPPPLCGEEMPSILERSFRLPFVHWRLC